MPVSLLQEVLRTRHCLIVDVPPSELHKEVSEFGLDAMAILGNLDVKREVQGKADHLFLRQLLIICF
jgi:hypothetical protein